MKKQVKKIVVEKIKQQKWGIFSVKEIDVCNYPGIDVNKKRPVLIWNNISLQKHTVCFWVGSKPPKIKKEFIIEIPSENKKIKSFVHLDKLFVIKSAKVNWTSKWFGIKDDNSKNLIKKTIELMFHKD